MQHVINVLEICCLGSNLSDFDNYGWRVSREYDNKIVQEIELGLRKWETLSKTICPTAWTYAKELVPKQKSSPPQNRTNGTSNPSNQRLCTTWNTFRKPGCSFENNNPGEQCVYLHVCSKCKTTKGVNVRHKAWQCTESEPTNRTPATSVASTTPVTSA